jgi:hypothetical protein
MTARPFACQPALAGRPIAPHLKLMPDKDKERAERLAAALRENLRKRKAQSRDLNQSEKTEEAKDRGS